MVMSIAVTSIEEEKNLQFGLIVFSTEYTEHNKLIRNWSDTVLRFLEYFQLSKSFSKKAILDTRSTHAVALNLDSI